MRKKKNEQTLLESMNEAQQEQEKIQGRKNKAKQSPVGERL